MSDVVSFHGKLGIGEQLQYRLRNLSEGIKKRDRQDFNEFKKIRHQAFTHLKEAVDLIREYGRYVFWRNSARLRKKEKKEKKEKKGTGKK